MTVATPLNPLQAPEKATAVQGMFNRIAGTYDLLNDCISLGLHRQWKERAVSALQLQTGDCVLDVCTGTGDLLRYLLQQVGSTGQVHGLDFSAQMLAVAYDRYGHELMEGRLSLVQGDALALPFGENTMDGAVVAFGLRNVTDIPQAVRELTRVVRPGKWVISLDTNPKPTLPGFQLYFKTVMPILGRMLSRDPEAYHYLSQSTERFLTPHQLAEVFSQAGLAHVQIQPLSMGAAALVMGQKPAF